MKRILITAAAMGLTASGALAYGTKTIDANEAVQAQRIEQGRYSGELTRREYRALKTEQARIQDLESRAKADGHVSRREYNRIHDAQINAYSNIKSETNDGQISLWRRWLYRTR
jgi:uncharacterized membrane protein YebE (DUF533 family)